MTPHEKSTPRKMRQREADSKRSKESRAATILRNQQRAAKRTGRSKLVIS